MKAKTMSTNTERAAWAESALQTFADEVFCGQSLQTMPRGDLQDCVADLIADLLHYARANRLNPEKRLTQALSNFNDETRGKPINGSDL